MSTIRLALVAALFSLPALAAELAHFVPLGLTPELRQIQARFDVPMAPLGQADAPAPFTVQCAPGHGYWIDERTWVYDLTTAPAPATTCTFTPVAGLKSLAGEPITTAPVYHVLTPGPKVVDIMPYAQDTIDEAQVFVLGLDAPATPASILENVHCAVQGIHERIPVQRLSGTERDTILALEPVREQFGDTPAERIEAVRCERPLPAKAKVALVWSQGAHSGAGRADSLDQSFVYTVRDHFVARLRCTRENARAGCMPLKPIRLEFSAQVARTTAVRAELKDATGKRYPAQLDSSRYVDAITFPGPFPAETKLTLSLPGEVRDDGGRALLNQDRFPLAVGVAGMPPLIKFSGPFGILERQTGGVLPVTLRNLDPGSEDGAAKIRWLRVDQDTDIQRWWQSLRDFENRFGDQVPDPRGQRLLDAKTPGLVELPLPKPAGAKEFEVVGLPLAKPGFYIVEAESRRLGRTLLDTDRPMYVRTTALVTNLAVHFKWGPRSSLAWVTRLDTGKPVPGAKIRVSDCRGRTLATGVSDARGTSFLPKGLPDPRAAEYDCPVWVTARAGDDLALARSDWDDGIESWRFNLPSDWNSEDRLAHSVLDRTLVRPGDTVHMKHLLREKQALGLRYPTRLPKTLLVEHRDSGQRWFLPLAWQNGAALTDWRVPASARRGAYVLRLVDPAITPDTAPEQMQSLEGLESGSFTVADFKVPLMKAAIDLGTRPLVGADTAEADVSVAYLSGGAARHLPVKLRAQLRPRHGVDFAAWPDYDFARPDDDADPTEQMLDAPAPSLDAAGQARVRIAGLPRRDMPQQLLLELEYTDPNGDIQTVSHRQDWWPAERLIGFKRPDWVKADSQTRLEFMVVDTTGQPVANAPVRATPTLRRDLSHRIRLAGGFYGYRDEVENVPLPGACEGATDAGGRFACTVASSESGQVVVAAETRDAAGRVARTHASYWVAGPGAWWFDQDNHDRIDLIPERKAYRPGETARLQVRMPFREATALVTVERDGILDTKVVNLSGQAPVIEVPVQAGWAPNVFISALVVRGRVAEPAATALVDLAKPAFKLGIARLDVDQREHRFEVKVTTDRAVYQTRDKARVELSLRTADGKPLPAATEVVVAVVDEGLLELADNTSWDLLPTLLAERGYNLRTFTGQGLVTGKRHFGRKALPPGGGGGRAPTRELFDTLVYWNPSVKVDAQGRARLDIPLNDSLSRFRVVAVASSLARFGTGATSLQTRKDLRLDAGLAPLLRTGDKLQARFTVRNGTDRAMKVALGAQIEGLGPQPARQVELAAGEGKEVQWLIEVPTGATRLGWFVNAREIGGAASDSVKVSQTVQPAIPVRPVSGQLYRLDQPLDLPVGPPTDALPNQGEVRATLAATLGDGLAGVRDYMRRYPYSCLEQQASKAIATGDRAAWDSLMEALPGYLDARGLATFFPGQMQGDVALSAYLLSASTDAGLPLPTAARGRLEQALVDYLGGRLEMPRARWLPDPTGTALRLAALAALARTGKATPELVDTVKIAPETWPAGQIVDWIEVLKRLPTLAQRASRLKAAEAALRARMSQTGSRLHLADDGQWWLMRSADTQVLRALLAVVDLPGWKADLPRLVAGSLGRQSRGHWDTTTANAWGRLAMDAYVRLHEPARPTGNSRAQLGGHARAVDWKAFPNGATASFPLPTKTETLSLRHQGTGAPFVHLATLAAVDLKQPVARGFAVTKTLIPIEQKTPGQWRRGDIVRVRLAVEARDAMGWVVVDDPVPAGASLLGGGLKRESSLLTASERGDDRAWPAWQERRFDRFQAYYEYVPRGRFTVEYTLRLNGEGRFNLPPTRVEAMYAPEMQGEAPNADFVVLP